LYKINKKQIFHLVNITAAFRRPTGQVLLIFSQFFSLFRNFLPLREIKCSLGKNTEKSGENGEIQGVFGENGRFLT
jgi:hypothetical protein